MSPDQLAHVAWELIAQDKGLLAIDESIGTCNRRFAALGIPQTAEKRREWRELLVTTPKLRQSISAVILSDETIRQTTGDGTSFLSLLADAEIIPGIKVDAGTTDLAGHPGEKITEGLDGLGARLDDYARIGARFAKWRGIITIADGLPSRGCIEANAQALARYAALCQQAGLVPMIEPEVLMAGRHDIARCGEVTEAVLRAVFRHCYEQGVALESAILKPNMVIAGADCPAQPGLDEIADATLAVLLRAVPAAVPGIAFLSGGQPAELATARLNAMNVRFLGRMPWRLTFSFARAIQQPALEIWGGQRDNVQAAQAMLAHRAECDRAARGGGYDPTMEGEPHSGAPSPALIR
ncbi:MAG: fructose-bisphosphate aldolase class I [Sphingomonadaceae bacterium]|nr:fructose-bisphosphate aldolase class I [Sphingomonadaceae bacterium]